LQRRVTLADVARRAGVSQTTASFVLTGRGDEMRISQQVRVRVEQAVRDTGYRPNVVSRSLRTGMTQTIGFVSDTVATTAFAGHLVWGALDAARESEHLLLIAETEGDPELEKEMIEVMRDRGVDGIVLASMSTRWATIPKGLLDGPSVLLNALPAKPCAIAAVIPDEKEAGRTAARALLEAGHTEGIYVVGAGPRRNQVPKGVVAAAERLSGILEVLDAANVQLAGGVVLGDWQPKAGYEATSELLKRKIETKALICLNDRLSFGAYHALEDAGRKVGQDVSVVSFDDELVASWVRPGLTSIAIPHYELGRKAIEVLLDGDGEAGREGHVYRVPMPLRQRDSIARVGRATP
jgi:LacI family transcriptional regulator